MKKTFLIVLLVALLVLPFAVVNQNTVVYDGHGFMISAGTMVRILEKSGNDCLISWDIHEAYIPCDHLNLFSIK